jgi:hypothetical protein
MPTCPSGHQSVSADFCDNCGIRIEGAPPSAPGPDPAQPAPPAPPTSSQPCPKCGTPQSGQFCEACGYDFKSDRPLPQPTPVPPRPAPDPVPNPTPPPAPPPKPDPAPAPPPKPAEGEAPGPAAQPAWTAVVTADRDYFDAVVAAGGPDAAMLEFPGYCPERRFRLVGSEMRIGRRSVNRGLQPEIDLTGPPADTGVSHLHAVLIADPDGGWLVVDPGSANGTKLNEQDLSTGMRTHLHDGDQICLGAWTKLTIVAG